MAKEKAAAAAADKPATEPKPAVTPPTEEKITVSWVIPFYKVPDPAWLIQAIQSCLDQDCGESFEVLVVNDGDLNWPKARLDALAAKHPQIKLLGQPGINQGIAAALNLGINQARGEYIARLDADDWNNSDRLTIQLKLMREGNYDAVGSGMKNHHLENAETRDMPPPVITNRESIKQILERGFVPIFHPTALMRTASLKRTSTFKDRYSKVRTDCFYPEDYKFAEDYALWWKFWNFQFKFGNCPELLVNYRIHDNQSGKKNFTIQRNSVAKAKREVHLLKGA